MPDGTLYGFTSSAQPTPSLYRINPTTAAATLIGPLGIGFVFEGALAFDPSDGTAFGMNQGSAAADSLFTINLTTGAATVIGLVPASQLDINGFTYVEPGTLLSLDRASNSLLSINSSSPFTITTIAAVPTTVGGVGGLTVDGGVGFYVTSGPAVGSAGSNSLYSFNMSTGVSTLIGSLGDTGTGFSGLAAPLASVPEPATLALLGLGLAGLALTRRKLH